MKRGMLCASTENEDVLTKVMLFADRQQIDRHDKNNFPHLSNRDA